MWAGRYAVLLFRVLQCFLQGNANALTELISYISSKEVEEMKKILTE